jgi:hypothetical protein
VPAARSRRIVSRQVLRADPPATRLTLDLERPAGQDVDESRWPMTPASRTLGDGRIKVPLGKVGRERKVGCPADEGDLLEQLED